MTKHTVKTIASGEYSCSCGAVWDRDEGSGCPNSAGTSETPAQLGTRLHAEAQEAIENSVTMRQLLGTQTLTDEICAALLQRDQPALAYRQKLAARLRVMPTGGLLKEAEAKDAPYISDDACPMETWAAGWNAYREAQTRAALSAPSHGEQVRDVLPGLELAHDLLWPAGVPVKFIRIIERAMRDARAAAPSAGSQGGDV